MKMAFEFLKKLQEGTQTNKRKEEEKIYSFLKNKTAHNKSISEEFKYFLNIYEKAFEMAKRDDIPETQSVFDYYRLKKMKEDIDEIIEKRTRLKVNKDIYFGTLESMELNAITKPFSRDNSYLMIINYGLIGAITNISNIIAFITDFSPSFLIKRVDKARLQLVKPFFINVIKKYILYTAKEDYLNIPIPFNTLPKMFWIVLEESTRKFMLGHEYAHILLNHFQSNTDQKRIPVLDKSKYGAFNDFVYWGGDLDTLTMEMDADKLSFDLNFMSIQQKFEGSEYRDFYSYIFAWLGFNLLFEIIFLFNRVFQVSSRTQIPSKTHPSPAARINHLLSYISTQLDNAKMQDLIDIRSGILRTLLILTKECESEITELINSNQEYIKNLKVKLKTIVANIESGDYYTP